MMCLLNVGLQVNRFVNVTVVYQTRITGKLDILNAQFFFLQPITGSPWSLGRSEKSRKEMCIVSRKSAFLKIFFPNCRSVILKERDTVNSTANLSTGRHLTNHLTNQSIPESGIMHGTAASLACLQAPPPFPPPKVT